MEEAEKTKLSSRIRECIDIELGKIRGRYYESLYLIKEDVTDSVSWCAKFNRENLSCTIPYSFEYRIVEGGLREYWTSNVYAGGLSYVWGVIECYDKTNRNKIAAIGLLGYIVYTTNAESSILLYLPLALSTLLVEEKKVEEKKNT